MGDYQALHSSQNIHCTTGKSHHVRQHADTDPVSEAVAFARSALAQVRARLQSIGVDQRDLDAAFAEAMAGLHGDSGRKPATATALSPAIPDTPGQDLRPDPGEAHSTADFLDCLRDYRTWAGNPSYRVMARRCGHRFAASTICTALRGRSIPSLEMVLAIVAACGGPEQHQREFASAWRRLVLPNQRRASAGVPGQARPDPATAR